MLVINMEMPKCCNECPLQNGGCCCDWGDDENGNDYDRALFRSPHCPIVNEIDIPYNGDELNKITM